MSPADKTNLVKTTATSLGFDGVGVAAAAPIPRAAYLDRWLADGRAGTMNYLYRHRALRASPAGLVEGAKSVIVVAMNYHQPAPPPVDDGAPRGRVAMYAWGDDYHRVLKNRLRELVDALGCAIEEPFVARSCVDTVPILERELAAAAGVGWIGKNTMVLNQDLGSYFFLGEVVTTLELEIDTPVADHCGTCTRCLDACPTDAFPEPYEMDAAKCISYLTIEHRGAIPIEMRASMGDWVFGCDICQEVCPYNRDAPVTRSFPIRSPGVTIALDQVADWSDDDYQRHVSGSAVSRATLDMLKRNAAIARRNRA